MAKPPPHDSVGPFLRLVTAHGPRPSNAAGYLVEKQSDSVGPFVRLGIADSRILPPELRSVKVKVHDNVGAFVRLAASHGNAGDSALYGRRGVPRLSEEVAPPLLVSYAYRQTWLRIQPKCMYYDWVLDSGAFSNHNKGLVIKLQHYIDFCRRLIDTDPTLVEIFALDVIGDWRASLRNTEEMWKQGVAAIPTYHYGEPEDVLRGYARDYPKVAVGGMAMLRGPTKSKFAEQCFARVWPCAVHGFAVTDEKHLLAVPWSSVDSTTWALGPVRYGSWRAFGGTAGRRKRQNANLWGSKQNLTPEIEYYLKLQRRMQAAWKSELEALPYRTGNLRP